MAVTNKINITIYTKVAANNEQDINKINNLT